VDQSADELTDTTHVIGPTYNIGHTHTITSGDSTNHDTEPESPATLNPLTWIPTRDGRRRTTEQDGSSHGGKYFYNGLFPWFDLIDFSTGMSYLQNQIQHKNYML